MDKITAKAGLELRDGESVSRNWDRFNSYDPGGLCKDQ